ncbi:MAG: hypothetical protein QG616_2284 [Pseudomonadota bacterium]|nr:hypothetical protein [Pseudomonadota bacterium]MDQ5960046.1 hypothetical protein [Pseudomonadota bacterium]
MALKERLRRLILSGQAEDAVAVLSIGEQLHATGELEAALRAFELVAERSPESIEAWNAVATLRFELGLLQGALRACESALRLSPSNPMVLFNTAVVLEAVGDIPAALHCYQRAIEIEPGHAGALLNLGPSLARAGLVAEAVAACDMALAYHPGTAAFHFNRGDVLLGAAEFVSALEAFEAALTLAPGDAKSELSAAVALAALGDLRSARTRMGNALALSPNLLSRYANPLRTDSVSFYPELSPERIFIFSRYDRVRTCDWSDYAVFARQFGNMIRGDGCPEIDNPDYAYISLGLPVTDELRQTLARNVARRIRASLGAGGFAKSRRERGPRLRIGYLSGDLRSHAVAYLIGGVFEMHDRSRFEVYVYSTGPDDGSRERQRSEQGADVFRDVSAFSGAVIGQLIAMDGIDILVDLSGYTLYGRPEAMALRPAPIQVSYLGFMGTQGAPWIDYSILDHTILTPTSRQWWDEKIAYLPSFYSPCEMPKCSSTDLRRPDAALPDEAFVLCALHMPRKIDPATFRLWLKVLEAIPHSVLWLISESPQIENNLGDAAEVFGISRQRLVFAPMVLREMHLARFRLADLFLDSASYNGHATTADALAMGLPVLTIVGSSVVSRVSEGMLNLCGLSALAANDEAQFVASAQRFANDQNWRRQLVHTLETTKTLTLFSVETRVREIEKACEMIWARHVAGLAPEDFDVSPSVK